LGGLIVTTVVVYLFTHKMELSAAVGLADTGVKLVAYYVHERLWLRVKFGLRRTTDYEI
jgi:uncharacterized membrane protein